MTQQGRWFLFGAVAVALAIDAIAWAAVTCHSPAGQTTLDSSPSCMEFWLNRYQGLIGALATLFAGFLAYRAAMSAAQHAERQARDARRAVLTDEIERLRHDIDVLEIAANYVGTYVGRYPSDGTDERAYFSVCQLARLTANDVVNQAALAARDGYGARIDTLMTAIHRLGEGSMKISSDQLSAAKLIGGEIFNRIAELRSVEEQIRSVIPRYLARLRTLRDELNTLAEN